MYSVKQRNPVRGPKCGLYQANSSLKNKQQLLTPLLVFSHSSPWGHVVSQMVEALRYKPEGRGFDSRWCHWIFHLHNPSGLTMSLGSTQPLTEMNTRNIS